MQDQLDNYLTYAQDQYSYKSWESDTYTESQENYYREASQKMMRVLHAAVAFSNESIANYWGVLFAISHPYVIGETMASVAAENGISRAAISNAANEFCLANNLPPSPYMRSLSKVSQSLKN